MRSTSTLCFLLLLSLCVSPDLARAQDLPLATDIPLPGVQAYSDDIPRPESVIGHRIGTRHTEPHQVINYFEAVAAVSDRVLLNEHARTYEGRPLIHAIVTSPANHARLEDIRQQNLRLSDAAADVSDVELQDLPAVVYMGYSIHGDEASGTEASVLLLYHLAAGSGQAVDDVLDNTIVIVDPMFNPDGRGRFTTWVNRNRGGVHTTDAQDREHNQPWPGGRTNHYWFDLNRDWLPAQHPESQGRLAIYHRWRPQVLTDFHEMGSNATFFFQPGIPSRTNPNTLQRNQELTGKIAEYHAEALDRIGQLYYTRESFDDFYYGKGSTYPDANGGIGILFEQASSRSLETETINGPLHYATTVRNQFATSLSTLEAVVDMREDLLRYQRTFYREAETLANDMPANAYVLSLERGRTRAQALAQVLRRHRIRIHTLARDLNADGMTFEAGSAYVIPVDQPQARFVKALFERTTSFPDSLFYDVSTWTLPLAFDVDYATVRRDPSDFIGEEVTDVSMDGGELIGGRSEYAYLLAWDRYFAPRALYRLQEEGVIPRLMHEPVTVPSGGQSVTVPRGTVVIPVTQPHVSADSVHALVQQIVAEDHVQVYAADTGLTPDGPDLGSRSADVLEQPTIALLTGSGTSGYNAGEVWHLLSERFDIPVSLIDVEDVDNADLSRYSTLIMAGGWYGNLPASDVEEWVRAGGNLIAITDAVDWVVQQKLVELAPRKLALDSLLQDLPYADLNEARGAQNIGGSIFEAELDTTHPLAYGLPESLPVFRTWDSFIDPPDAPGSTVGVYSDAPLLSGYISEEQLDHLRNSAAVIAQRQGRGRVMLLMDNPNFRAFWYGTNRLFLNTLFFGDAY